VSSARLCTDAQTRAAGRLLNEWLGDA